LGTRAASNHWNLADARWDRITKLGENRQKQHSSVKSQLRGATGKQAEAPGIGVEVDRKRVEAGAQVVEIEQISERGEVRHPHSHFDYNTGAGSLRVVGDKTMHRRTAGLLSRISHINALRIFFVALVLWCELGIFLWSVSDCQWPGSLPALRILLVADPQVLDHRSYPDRPQAISRLTQFIVDFNLRKSWSVASRFYPDVVVFLGDMTDGGRFAMRRNEYVACATGVWIISLTFPKDTESMWLDLDTSSSLSKMPPPIFCPAITMLGMHPCSLATTLF
jgi:hypothetical protein